MSFAPAIARLASTDQDKLRAWIVLLGKSNVLKKIIDGRLKAQFGVSISRFDVLSALERGGENGLKAGELTRMLVVSDGNTTQVTNKLVRDGLVVRSIGKKDRRCVIYTLTRDGAGLFKTMADGNRGWIADAFSNFTDSDLELLIILLGKLNINELNKN